MALGLAVAAAVAVKVPALFGMDLDEDADFYARNLSLFVLPLLIGYFVWKRPVTSHRPLAGARVRRCCRVRQRLSVRPGQLHRRPLTALHLPIALWLVVAIAYAGSRNAWKAAWTSSASRASCSSTTC